MTLEIVNKRSSALNSKPTAAQLEDGEIGINYNADSLALYVKDTNGDIRKIAGEGSVGQYWDLTGNTLSPDSNTYGLDIGAGNIVLNVNGTAAFSGKVTSAATVAGDAATTLTTKGYVDSIAGGGTNLGISNRTATTLEVTSSTGTNATVPAASTTEAGLMTDAQFDKLNGISPGAQVNVQSDWTETDTSADSFIQNKPTIPTDLGVLSIIAGSNISISPATGVGNVTINATGGGGSTQIQWNISTNGSIEYIFEGPGFDPSAANPTLYVVRGQTYVFNKTVSGHPFQLQAAAGSGQAPYTLGVTGNQPIADENSITWVVPMDAPTTLYYACTAHPNAMAGTINVLAPGGGGGGANIEVSVDPPGAPSVGDLWWDSSEGATSNGGRLYLYYGSQWVQTSNIGGGSGGGGDSLWTLNGTLLSPANAGNGTALTTDDNEGIFAFTPSQTGSGYQFYVHDDEGLIHLTASDYNNNYFLADSTQVGIGSTDSGFAINLNYDGSITATGLGEFSGKLYALHNGNHPSEASLNISGANNTKFIQFYDRVNTTNASFTYDNGTLGYDGSAIQLGINGGNTQTANLYIYNTANGETINNGALISRGSKGTITIPLYIGNAAIQTSCDVRLKKDIEDTTIDVIKKLKDVRVVDFTWDDPSDQCFNNRNRRGRWTGVIAQELIDVFPFAVNAPRTQKTKGAVDHDDETPWTVDLDALVPVLIKGFQEQQAKIEALEAEIQLLKGGNN